jgi:hypothetical protein
LLTQPNQSQPEKVVWFSSFVQNLAEINQLIFAYPTQPIPTRKSCQVSTFIQSVAEINQLIFANPTKPNQKKLSGSSTSFKTLQKSIN